jgi:choline dehydrogenase-like flavoprotein
MTRRVSGLATPRVAAQTATIEADILIVGSGITAAMMAAHLAEHTTRPITVVEAGRASTPFAERATARERYLAYGESPWKQDHLDDQTAYGTTWGFAQHDRRWTRDALGRGGPAVSLEFRLKSLFGVGTIGVRTTIRPFYWRPRNHGDRWREPCARSARVNPIRCHRCRSTTIRKPQQWVTGPVT